MTSCRGEVSLFCLSVNNSQESFFLLTTEYWSYFSGACTQWSSHRSPSNLCWRSSSKSHLSFSLDFKIQITWCFGPFLLATRLTVMSFILAVYSCRWWRHTTCTTLRVSVLRANWRRQKSRRRSTLARLMTLACVMATMIVHSVEVL